MTQQDHGNPSDMASVMREARKTRKVLKDVEARIHELKEQAQKTKEQQDQTTRNIQSALAFTFFVVIASHFLFYPSLTMKNMNTRIETTKLKEEAVSEPDILTAIVGSWQIVSSTGTDQFVERWKSYETVSRRREDAFRYGVSHIEFNKENQTLSYMTSVGTEIYGTEVVKLGEQTEKKGVSFLTFVKKNQLDTMWWVDKEEPMLRDECFIKDGQLHCVFKIWGLTRTTVYQKVDYEEMKKGLKERVEKPKEEHEEKNKEEPLFDQICTLIQKLFTLHLTLINLVLKPLGIPL